MENKKRVKWAVIIFALIFFVSGATALTDNYCIKTRVTDVTPSSVRIGDSVTVGIQFDNCGADLPKHLSFKITQLSKNIKIKEPLIINFDTPFGYANSKRFNVFHMFVTNNATPGIYVFKYKVEYGSDNFKISQDGNFSITVTSKRAYLDIAYIKTEPIIPAIGDKTTLTIRLENFGKGDANSVKAEVSLPFSGDKESFLGELESDDDSSAVFNFVPNSSGTINYNMTVTYVDDFGRHNFTEPLRIYVEGNSTNSLFLFFEVIIFIIILTGAFYYFKLKKQQKKKGGN